MKSITGTYVASLIQRTDASIKINNFIAEYKYVNAFSIELEIAKEIFINNYDKIFL